MIAIQHDLDLILQFSNPGREPIYLGLSKPMQIIQKQTKKSFIVLVQISSAQES